jgi:hypothetical protein
MRLVRKLLLDNDFLGMAAFGYIKEQSFMVPRKLDKEMTPCPRLFCYSNTKRTTPWIFCSTETTYSNPIPPKVECKTSQIERRSYEPGTRSIVVL